METVSFKVQGEILKRIDSILKPLNFNNRTEFIREAIRTKLNQVEEEKDPFLKVLRKFQGSAKVKVSDKRHREIREQVGREIAQKFGIKLD